MLPYGGVPSPELALALKQIQAAHPLSRAFSKGIISSMATLQNLEENAGLTDMRDSFESGPRSRNQHPGYPRRGTVTGSPQYDLESREECPVELYVNCLSMRDPLANILLSDDEAVAEEKLKFEKASKESKWI